MFILGLFVGSLIGYVLCALTRLLKDDNTELAEKIKDPIDAAFNEQKAAYKREYDKRLKERRMMGDFHSGF